MLGDLNKLKVVELKAELSSRGLDTKGVKAVLIDRLKAALEEEGGGGAASGTEDHRSPQESSDETEEVPPTPSRRGRRATMSRDTEQDDTAQGQDLTESVPEEPQCTPSDDVPINDAMPAIQEDPFTVEEEQPPHSEEQPAVEEEQPACEEQPPVVSQTESYHEEPSPSSESEPPVSEDNDGTAKQSDEDGSSMDTLSQPMETSQPQSTSDNLSSVESTALLAPEEGSSLSVSTGEVFASNTTEYTEGELLGEEDSKLSSVEGGGDSQSSLPDFVDVKPQTFEFEGSQPENISEDAQDSADIKVEPPDSQSMNSDNVSDKDVTLETVKEEPVDGGRRARKSRFTDNEDLPQSSLDVKEEPMDSEAAPSDSDSSRIKSEPSNDRKRRRSSSRSPRRSRSPPARRQDDEPDIDNTAVLLSWYDSDLNLVIDKSDFLTATPMHQQGFGYVWAGSRASFGFAKGKVCYEVKCIEACDVSHLEDEPNPHVLRIGWSVRETSMQLGEENLSYGYGGTGKASVNCQFKDYGNTFDIGDTVTAYVDLDSEPKVLSFSKNGEPQGVAFEVSSEVLDGKPLFPHILSKNVKFSVNFSGEAAFPILEGYTLCGLVPLEDRVAGPQRPEKKDECEAIMMCGLPGCGKTTWANKHAAENPEKLFNILGTNNLIDKMKVMGLPRKRNYSGRWEVLIEKCTKCLNKLLEIAGRRRRNYILDQTNVYPSAVRRKMKAFDGFKRRAVVIVPTDDEFQRRVAKREAEEGKDVPDHAVLEMKANFKVPEVGELFTEVTFVELPEEEAKAVVEKYHEEAKGKGFLAQVSSGPAKRFKSERTGSSGDRRFDDRSRDRDHRERRDYRDSRDNRDNRDNRDFRDRGNSYRPRGGHHGGDRNNRWQPRGGGGHQGGGWRGRNDGFRGGRPDNRGSWRSGGDRNMGGGGGYDRHRSGGYNQGRGGYGGGRGGSKGWGYNQGSGGSSWGTWNQQVQPDYSQQWQGQSQSQGASTGYNSTWKGYGQQSQQQTASYNSAQTGYNTQGYSSYGNGSNTYNWNQQYYQYGNWGQQQQQATAATGATALTGTTTPAVGATSSTPAASTTGAAYDPYQWNNQFSSYGYSTSTGSATAGATGTSSHSGK